MTSRLTTKLLWLAFAATAFIGSWWLSDAVRDDGQAATLPGTVTQSATAEQQGITVTLDKAVFSASATDLWIIVTFSTPAVQPAGVGPADALLGGQPAASGLVSNDGRVVLRFPPLPDPGSRATETLRVSAVQVLNDEGRIERLQGAWELTVQLPSGDDARDAARLEALTPAVLDIGGQNVLIEGFRTSSATIVRYQLPDGVLETRPPAVRTGTRTATLTRSAENSVFGEVELWFEPSAFGAPLTVTFDALQSSNQDGARQTLRARIEPFEPPVAAGPDAPAEDHTLAWQAIDEAKGGTFQSIVWHRDISGVTIIAAIEGIWDPTASGKPEVTADGSSLFVRGVVNYPATDQRGDQTTVEAVLPDGRVPRELAVTVGGASSPIQSTEVTLLP